MRWVFVLGNATVDITMNLAAFPAPGGFSLADAVRRRPRRQGPQRGRGGARAGAAVTFVSPVGDDEAGAFLRAFLSGEPGLDMRWIPSGRPSDMSVILVSGDGENMIVSSAESARALDPDAVPGLLDGIGTGDTLLLQGNLSADTTLAACRRAREAGARVMLNPAPLAWDVTDMLPLAHVLICNVPEARAITGATGEGAARRLVEMGAGAVILTLGACGAMLLADGDVTTIPTAPARATDTSGAGDAVAGVTAAALTLGAPRSTPCGSGCAPPQSR